MESPVENKANKIGIGSIFHYARAHGYRLPYERNKQQAEDAFDDIASNDNAIEIFKASDLFGLDIPEPCFSVKDFMISGAPISLYGKGGVGKSLLSLQLCVSLSLGNPFMGCETIKSKCLIVSCEDDRNEIHRRLNRICNHQGISLDQLTDMYLCCREGQDNILVYKASGEERMISSPFFDSLKALIDDEKFDFIVIDNVADVYGGDENVRNQVRGFVSQIYNLCKQNNATIMLLAHPPKTGENYSGSTAWNASVRQRFMLKKNDNSVFELICEKANYLPDGHKITLEMVDGVFIPDDLIGQVDPEIVSLDEACLKLKIYELIANKNKIGHTVSYSSNSAANVNILKLLRENKIGMNSGRRDLSALIDEMLSEGKIQYDGSTKKLLAV